MHDGVGNVLVDFRFAAESERVALANRQPRPLSLTVVLRAGRVLMVFDRRRERWELLGGMREPGETARQAAVRELSDDTPHDDMSPLDAEIGRRGYGAAVHRPVPLPLTP